MPLEKQVTSLELSQKLRDLGVKQESLFWWREIDDEDGEGRITTFTEVIDYGSTKNGDVSAFTVAELGEMLPKQYTTWRDDKGFFVEGYNDKTFRNFQEANTEADARAKMLIYLLENKLITI